jgi:hypothetical protein
VLVNGEHMFSTAEIAEHIAIAFDGEHGASHPVESASH